MHFICDREDGFESKSLFAGLVVIGRVFLGALPCCTDGFDVLTSESILICFDREGLRGNSESQKWLDIFALPLQESRIVRILYYLVQEAVLRRIQLFCDATGSEVLQADYCWDLTLWCN